MRFADQLYRKITVRYLIAIALFCSIVIGEEVLSLRVLESEEYDAAIINMSGRQRMLSQRISLLALEASFLKTGPETKNVSNKTRTTELQTLVTQFQETHKILINGGPGTNDSLLENAALRDLYHGAGKLDQHARHYVSIAQDILVMLIKGQHDRETLEVLQNAQNNLLPLLEQAVTIYEQIANSKSEQLKTIQRGLFVSLVILLAVLVLFIFRPTAKRVRSTLLELEEKSAEIEAARLERAAVAAISDNAPEPILTFGQDGNSRYSNAAADAMLRHHSLSAEELLSQLLGSSNVNDGDISENLSELWLDDQCYSAVISVSVSHSTRVYLRDITAQRKAEKLSIHAQKMEVIGQLTGGIAHDFNNILTVIQGSQELAAKKLSMLGTSVSQVTNLLMVANDAAVRGAKLTKSLLAFSRKQTLDPELVIVGDAIDQILPLLQNAVGDTVTIVYPAPSTNDHIIRVDRAQFDTMLLNLCVNARDAMPTGGQITLTIGHQTVTSPFTLRDDVVPTGNYCSVSVCDTGTGIDDKVMDNIFDPFFTTKDVGKGTGLGLSMVHGFVRQSGGYVLVKPALHQGVCFDVFFPISLPSPQQ